MGRWKVALAARMCARIVLPAHSPSRARIAAIAGCAVVGEGLVGQAGVAGWDPLRIVIDVRGTGRTGYDVAAALRSRYDIHVELATHATLVLVLGIGQPVAALERVPRMSGVSAHLVQHLRDRLVDHTAYIHAHGEDMPEVTGWRWSA